MMDESLHIDETLQMASAVAPPIPATVSASRSFETFFELESPVLYRRMCLVTGNRSEAEEIMQDSFLKLWERWDQVATMDDPTGYLYRTAMNTYRRHSRRAALALKRAIGLASPTDEFATADAKRTVTRALATLTPRQRAALVLTELIGFSSEEASAMLGVRASTVRALATQGRQSLKRRMPVPRPAVFSPDADRCG